MLYSRLVETYEKINDTTKRKEKTAALVDLLRETPPGSIGRVVYLTQGKLHPDFEGIELGMAERLALRAVAQASGQSEDAVQRSLSATGDLGPPRSWRCEAGRG